MKNKSEVIGQINFHLNELGAHNQQHEFEHIVRHFARQRITPNILIATGPVQSGGDQGRDFETFKSFVSPFGDDNSKFIGEIDYTKKIVFCCSLEQDYQTKVKRDVRSVLSHKELPVDYIYFFSSHNIPIGKKNKLKKWAVRNFKIEIEIFDRQAIAENLADIDVFWIAVKYLSLPADLMPIPEEEVDWYQKLCVEYRESLSIKTAPPTYQEFVDIKMAARHIYKKKEFRTDLLLWIELMKQIAEKAIFQHIKLKALYEIIVYHANGLNDTNDIDNYFLEYIQQAKDVRSHEQLEDAINIIVILINSIRGGESQIHIDLALEFESDISKQLTNSVEQANSHDVRCYLEVINTFWLKSDIHSLEEFLEKIASKLPQIITTLSNTPLYPVTALLSMMNKYMVILLEYDLDDCDDFGTYEKLLSQISEISAKRSGDFDQGQELINRSHIYLDKGRSLKALNCLHEAKEFWFKAESIEKSIEVCLEISRIYKLEGLLFASKLYALFASYISFHVGDLRYISYFPQSMLRVSNIDYSLGNWAIFLEGCDHAMMVGQHVINDYLFSHQDTTEVFFNTWVVRYIAKRYQTGVFDLVDQISSQWYFFKEDFDEADKRFSERYDELDNEKLWKTIDEELSGVPFSDLGNSCGYSFIILGLEWNINFENSFENRCAAEYFASIVQILFESLSQYDLCIIENSLVVKVRASSSFHVHHFEDETPYRAIVDFPIEVYLEGLDELVSVHRRCISQVFAMVYANSLLPDKEYHRIVKEIIDSDFDTKLIYISSFGSCFQKFYDQTKLERRKLFSYSAPFPNKRILSNASATFQWDDTLSKYYDRESVESHINNRYTHAVSKIEITLPILNKSSKFLATVKTLKAKGFKDWHILHAISNIVVNYKTDKEELIKKGPKYLEEYWQKPESEDYRPIPEKLFTLEYIEEQWGFLLISLLPSYGLEYNLTMPNLNSLEKILKLRFRLYEDDVDHRKLFED